MKEITIVPYAGLCNRLNTIVCAIEFHREHPDVIMNVYWHKYIHCNCKFSDLFLPLDDNLPQIKELHGIKNRPGTKLNCYLPEKLRSLWYDCILSPNSDADSFERLTMGHDRVYVHKDNRFCKCVDKTNYSEYFHPQHFIQKRIDSIVCSWPNRVVGLHIRRTDNKKSISDSPTNHFYEVIENELSKNSNTYFYLASDDDTEKKRFRDLYGNRILFSDLTLKRYSRQ